MKKYLPKANTLILVIISIVYLPLGTMYAAKEIFTGTAELLAKEVVYVEQGKAQRDRLDELTRRYMAELSAEYQSKLRNEARTKAIETLEAELEEEKEALREDEMSFTSPREH